MLEGGEDEIRYKRLMRGSSQEVHRQGLPSVDGGLLVNLNQAGSCRVRARGRCKAKNKDWIPGVAMTYRC